MDTECYRNYWSIGFRDVTGKRVVRIRKYNDSPLDTQRIAKIFKSWRIISFNGLNYDMQMIAAAMAGKTNSELKDLSDAIIKGGVRPWKFYETFNIPKLPSFIDHVDLWEVSPGSPGKPSLKIYAGRLHSKRMQELPFPHDTVLDDDQVVILEGYHDNDLDVTNDFWFELEPQVKLRAQLSDEYGVDLRSKSDAQVAEAVMKAEIERLTGKKLWKPDWKPTTFPYVPPPYIKFKTSEMQSMLNRISGAQFLLHADGKVYEPEFLKKMPMQIGDGIYTMGIGGIHTKEKASWHRSDGTFLILDRDVTSYYPSIILLLGLFPKHIGLPFIKILRKLFDKRITAKQAAKDCEAALDELRARGFADIAETLKIVLNGLFGKFGSQHSVVFAPHLMVATTITGQLSVLMLVEELYLRGFKVVSANTDGFVTLVPIERRDEFNAVMMEWEWDTGLMTEETEYQWLYSANVNNYVALDKKGKIKRKGRAATPAGPGQKGASGMKKNPATEICIEAVVAFLKDGSSIEDTVHYCEDIRKFVAVGQVNEGGCNDQNGDFVGSAIRWYYAKGVTGPFTRVSNGNSVARTTGAKECLTLPDALPDDLDHDWYVREAYAIMQDYGVEVQDPIFVGRKGFMTAILEDQKTYHTIDVSNGVALCGKEAKSIRDSWIEAKKINPAFRMCSKCVKLGDL